MSEATPKYVTISERKAREAARRGAAAPLDVRNARPAILSLELCTAIDETRRFRNLAARGYDNFDPEKGMPTVMAARVIIHRLLDEIDEFRTTIDGD